MSADWAFFWISLACTSLFVWWAWWMVQIVRNWWRDR